VAGQPGGRADSLLFGYALGKAQRLLAGVDRSIGPIYLHGAVVPLTRAYREAGIDLPEATYVGAAGAGHGLGRLAGRRAAVGQRDALDPEVRADIDRIRLGLDAAPRGPAEAVGRPGVRPVGPLRLARPALVDRRDRGPSGSCSPTATRPS
jgi:hypothetical protein